MFMCVYVRVYMCVRVVLSQTKPSTRLDSPLSYIFLDPYPGTKLGMCPVGSDRAPKKV